MTSDGLARSYLAKARLRIFALETLFDHAGYSDVVREAQEVVELAMKGILRSLGMDPPKIHDVGKIVGTQAHRLPGISAEELRALIEASAWLRRERELSFYGDIDFIPTEEYTRTDGERALQAARLAWALLDRVISDGEDPDPAGSGMA